MPVKRTIWMWLCLCCLLAGCTNPFSGRYVSVTPYQQEGGWEVKKNISVENEAQLYEILCAAVAEGMTDLLIDVDQYAAGNAKDDINDVVARLKSEDPIANYAMADVQYDYGKSGDKMSLDVHIAYIHDRAEILSVKQASDMNEATQIIANALLQCDSGVVMHISEFQLVDFAQVVETYALEHPDEVMEVPRVAVNLYPEHGEKRVAELRFTYQTSRDALKAMQSQVQSVFTSAALYTSGNASQKDQYTQLFVFLTERYDYRIATSITPAYSLLHYGVGDSKAFAMVYSAMCRQAGLSAQVVSGTYWGHSRSWVIIGIEDEYYHLDLLEESFAPKTDKQMKGYVWDYSAYPKC